jgi:uncharacterized membrane protein
MKLVYPLTILFIAIALTFFGALFKLDSWEGASEMLILGIIAQLVAIGMLFYRAIKNQNKI